MLGIPQIKNQDKTDIENKEQWKKTVAIMVSVYTVAILSIGLYTFTSIWPSNSADLATNQTMTVTLRGTGVSFQLGPETQLLLVMIIAGAIGACVFSLFAIAHHLGAQKDFDVQWQAWYYLRPFVGAGLAMIFYFLVRGGVLAIGANLQGLNLIVVAGLSALVGMFSEQALHKLQDLADTTFGAAPGGNTTNEPASPGQTKQ